MGITAESPRGGLVETLRGETHTFLLRMREIERFEDKHRGIFSLWDAFFSGGQPPSSAEVRDLLALALVGGGKTDTQADAVMNAITPEDLRRCLAIAQAVLGVAFMPDVGDKPAGKKKEASA